MSANTLKPERVIPAGFFSRLEAFMIDLLLITFIGLTAGVVIGLVFYFFRLDRILDFLTSMVPAIENSLQKITLLVSPIIFILTAGYFVFFWTLMGSTPGKTLLGLRVMRSDGRSLGFGRSTLRFFGYWVSAIPLFLGFIWILIDRRHKGWHDKLADTQVVYTFRLPSR